MALTKQHSLFTSKWNLNLRKKLLECYIWCIALQSVES
jgi:hypothetical protein